MFRLENGGSEGPAWRMEDLASCRWAGPSIKRDKEKSTMQKKAWMMTKTFIVDWDRGGSGLDKCYCPPPRTLQGRPSPIQVEFCQHWGPGFCLKLVHLVQQLVPCGMECLPIAGGGVGFGLVLVPADPVKFPLIMAIFGAFGSGECAIALPTPKPHQKLALPPPRPTQSTPPQGCYGC